MTCAYMGDRGRCTYRRTQHIENHEFIFTLCQGLPEQCPWHVMLDKEARP